MNWEQALAEIDSHEFDARLGVVSNIGSFFRAAASEPAVRLIFKHMLESGDACEEILDRIYDLAYLCPDARYENPNDTPLAILLWMMYYANSNYAMAAYYVDQAPQCWYAKKLARRILVPPPADTVDTQVDEVPGGPIITRTVSSDTLFLVNPVLGSRDAWGHMLTEIDVSSGAGAVTQEAP
jgi:hypothetical protein